MQQFLIVNTLPAFIRAHFLQDAKQEIFYDEYYVNCYKH